MCLHIYVYICSNPFLSLHSNKYNGMERSMMHTVLRNTFKIGSVVRIGGTLFALVSKQAKMPSSL